jgi:chondroitin AC lyase
VGGRCDYYAHHRPGFSTSVLAYSQNTYNAECVNSEGKKSWHLADGANPTYISGSDYKDVYPVWNWVQVR